MKHLLLFLFVLSTLSTVHSQTSKKRDKRLRASYSVEAMVGTDGHIKEYFSYGAGLSFGINYRISHKFSIMLTSDLDGMQPRNNQFPTLKGMLLNPTLLGVKYFITERLYTTLEGGTNQNVLLYKDVDENLNYAAAKITFIAVPGIGVRFGSLNLGLRYKYTKGLGVLAFRVGYLKYKKSH
jgi:hypothetical protein